MAPLFSFLGWPAPVRAMTKAGTNQAAEGLWPPVRLEKAVPDQLVAGTK